MGFVTDALKERRDRWTSEKKKKKDEFDSKLTPYDFLIQIADKKTKHPYDKKIAPAFLLLQWFSQDNYCIDIIHAINHLQFGLKDDIIYQYLFHKIPKNMSIPKWIKKESDNIDKKIEEIKIKYGVSTHEALMIKNHEERLSAK
jgi:hypothetical protein